MPKSKVKTQEVVNAYKRTGGSITKTAEALSISRRTVYEHLVRAGYYEFKVAGPGFLRFRRRLPKPEKPKPDSNNWRHVEPPKPKE